MTLVGRDRALEVLGMAPGPNAGKWAWYNAGRKLNTLPLRVYKVERTRGFRYDLDELKRLAPTIRCAAS